MLLILLSDVLPWTQSTHDSSPTPKHVLAKLFTRLYRSNKNETRMNVPHTEKEQSAQEEI